ncbi:UNVERIFIED_CONTAM: hypothetical protein B566_EDAN017904 [Ephemera danica]|nr:hypothetical protein B566_EDAN017904 [Ephemera danica]
MQFNLSVLDKLDSDHLPVVLTAQMGIITENPQRRNYKKADWEKFKLITKQIPSMSNLETPKDIDTAVDTLTSTIKLKIEKSVPLVAYKTEVDELPMEIKDMINTRNRYRRSHRRTGDARVKSEGKNSKGHKLAITFNGEKVKEVTTAKYLGVTLDPCKQHYNPGALITVFSNSEPTWWEKTPRPATAKCAAQSAAAHTMALELERPELAGMFPVTATISPP